jgi:hypothetical protein
MSPVAALGISIIQYTSIHRYTCTQSSYIQHSVPPWLRTVTFDRHFLAVTYDCPNFCHVFLEAEALELIHQNVHNLTNSLHQLHTQPKRFNDIERPFLALVPDSAPPWRMPHPNPSSRNAIDGRYVYVWFTKGIVTGVDTYIPCSTIFRGEHHGRARALSKAPIITLVLAFSRLSSGSIHHTTQQQI